MASNASLVLNASFEPLHAVTVARAVTLVVGGRATVLEEDLERQIRSERISLGRPLVIQLLRQAPVPYRTGAGFSKRAVLRRDAHRCAYCGRSADSVDHVVPRCQGGADQWENTVAACRPCNQRKAGRTPDQAGMQLLYRPSIPRGARALAVSFERVHAEWKPYLS
jgi:5-methylcytosine-specific restriction endonuclease McrA